MGTGGPAGVIARLVETSWLLKGGMIDLPELVEAGASHPTDFRAYVALPPSEPRPGQRILREGNQRVGELARLAG
ncbi:MAG: hypothetical protein KDA42_03645 [Planctomycetales bacterium]|nr:hypothetical protein [Planctomycetales bacterium]